MAPAEPRRPARENRTRWVVLGMLAAAPMTGYRLRQAIADSVGHFWQESFGQLYPALRRLTAEGLVEARATQGGPGRGGATYHVTPRGRAALARWLALPPVLEKQRNEVLLKVFFAGAVPTEVTSRNLGGVASALRAELGALEAIAREIGQAGRAEHPHAPYWRLTLDFGIEFYRMALGWLDRSQRVLARAQPATSPSPAATPRPARPRPSRRPATSRSSR